MNKHWSSVPIAAVLFCAAMAFVASLSSGSAVAFPTGQTGLSGSGGATCANCHDGATETASISIAAPESIEPGETASLTIWVQGGAGVVGGFNAATSGLTGVFTAGSGSQVLDGEVTHASAQPFVDGRASWAFSWTAPDEVGDFDLFVAAVSADGDISPDGDAVATTSVRLAVAAAVTPTPEPTPEATNDPQSPMPTVAPVVSPASAAGVTHSAGAYGFGLNPQASGPIPGAPSAALAAGSGATLANTGSASPGSTTVAVALIGVGATFVVTARRSRRRYL